MSEPFKDATTIWNDAVFPCRLGVKVLVSLTPETGVPILDLKDKLAVFEDLKSPFTWTAHFRASPAKWKAPDAEIVVAAIREAEKNPVDRPLDPAKLARRPPALRTKLGAVEVAVTVPESEPIIAEVSTSAAANLTNGPTAHEEIQWLLLKLGNDMGLDLWVARNDRGREVNGNKFSNLSRLKPDLPLQFDDVTNRTIELIDVLWLKGNAIVAAFEIESTTSIYSGLLRMSDLIAMQPNLNIPLFLVAPDERRDKVIIEVNRPTFSRLSPPMNQMCRFISFSSLRKNIAQVSSFLRHLKPEFLDDLSESCELGDD